MMSDSENQLSEEQINALVEALPHALHPVDRDIKVALVRNGYRNLDDFPVSAEDNHAWDNLKADCGFIKYAPCNALKRRLFPHQPQQAPGK